MRSLWRVTQFVSAAPATARLNDVNAAVGRTQYMVGRCGGGGGGDDAPVILAKWSRGKLPRHECRSGSRAARQSCPARASITCSRREGGGGMLTGAPIEAPARRCSLRCFTGALVTGPANTPSLQLLLLCQRMASVLKGGLSVCLSVCELR